MDGLKKGRAAGDLSRMPAPSREQHRQRTAHARPIERGLLRPEKALKRLQPSVLLLLRDLTGRGRGGRAGPGRIFEAESLRETDSAHEIERRGEVGLGLAWVADDEIRREGDFRPS